MRKHNEEQLDPTRPALVVLYGTTRKKVRPLEGDLIILGRSPGSDIGLVSPEVAHVHCVIVRLDSGWRIRDCSGRSTRLNGKAITDEPLRDGDVLQIGTFSFEAHLPATAPPPPAPAAPNRPGLVVGVAQLARLQASRRRLGELALSLRRQLRERGDETSELARREADLAQVERRARATHQENLERKTALDRRQAELDAYATALRRQAQQQREQQRQADDQAEVDLARQGQDLAHEREDLHQWRQQLQVRQREVETMVAQLEAALAREQEGLAAQRAQQAIQEAALEQQRLALRREREALARMYADLPLADRTPGTRSTRDTHHDTPDGLEGARQFLRELNERRMSAETKHDEPRPVGSKQVPAIE